MEKEQLTEILQAHKEWLDSDGREGVRADLRYADLRGADLRGADLRDADLRYADLRDANLRGANLCGADLRNADLRGVDMDFAVLPLWCGGLHMHVDDRIGIQMLYHAVANILFSKNTSAWLKKAVSIKTILNVVNKFHHVNECGDLEAYDAAYFVGYIRVEYRQCHNYGIYVLRLQRAYRDICRQRLDYRQRYLFIR